MIGSDRSTNARVRPGQLCQPLPRQLEAALHSKQARAYEAVSKRFCDLLRPTVSVCKCNGLRALRVGAFPDDGLYRPVQRGIVQDYGHAVSYRRSISPKNSDWPALRSRPNSRVPHQTRLGCYIASTCLSIYISPSSC